MFWNPTTCGGNFWGADNLYWAKACSLCSQLTALTPNGPTEVAGNGHQIVCFGVPTTVGPRLVPLVSNVLPSLRMDQFGGRGNGD